MRILWLSHIVPGPSGSGAMQRSFNLLRGVARYHEVTLLAYNQARLLRTPADVEAARRLLETVCRRVAIYPIPADASRLARAALIARAFLSPTPFVNLWLDSPDYREGLLRALREESFDLAHVDTIGLAHYVPLLDGRSVVLNHHNVESHMMARRADREADPLRRWYFRREAVKIRTMEQRHGRQASLNVVVSQLDRSRLREVIGEAPVAVCPNGTDPTYFRPGSGTPEPGHLLFVGGMSWYPNLEAVRYFTREVWPELVRRRPASRLTVVGGDPPVDLRRLAGEDARIRVTGFVDDVRPYFERADIFVCPIRDGGGTRLKVLDAMAMARPVVSTSLGCEGLDLEPGRDFLVADTSEAFVAQICRLLDDPGLKRTMAARGRKVVLEKYAWEAIVRGLLADYDRLLAASRAPAPEPTADEGGRTERAVGSGPRGGRGGPATRTGAVMK